MIYVVVNRQAGQPATSDEQDRFSSLSDAYRACEEEMRYVSDDLRYAMLSKEEVTTWDIVTSRERGLMVGVSEANVETFIFSLLGWRLLLQQLVENGRASWMNSK